MNMKKAGSRKFMYYSHGRCFRWEKISIFTKILSKFSELIKALSNLSSMKSSYKNMMQQVRIYKKKHFQNAFERLVNKTANYYNKKV